ncbi:tRNA-splicing ligase RtcB [Mucilaginibacter pineti]|uniref:3'-phosphate/5'-hydroxy nucleic acid ligase n=1 Tax=Mucilaginibacter pineti TaxID=1391627 RepID=A0A1G7DLG6_9SPHI|nr:RtcB family protein [Mucilaginibacter pineti]SDE52387.1 tRNA-splicing ligase RtcB [Mucilaginibacter pineti]
MGNLKIKELDSIGYVDNRLKSIVINTIAKHFKHHTNEDIISILIHIRDNPDTYVNDAIKSKIALAFISEKHDLPANEYQLMQTLTPIKIYGADEIEDAAKQQMALALSLPISIQGALMPDAHSGYGLPIGGVLATRNAVIPYGVGMDIGCRMTLTIIDADEKFLNRYDHQIKKVLFSDTHFGMEGGLAVAQYHEVLDDSRFKATPLLKKLHGKAIKQLGTSGSGNHFVEFGMIKLADNNTLGLPGNSYMALLSHSGSRGLGANIARHYTQVAMDTCKLPRQAQPLAWLNLDTEAGQEYWLSMNLAGDYARACHDRIHANLLKTLGLKALHKTENHHNFAWREKLADGAEAIIHRKGATPAHEGELGIIPGSMATPAYLVAGKGNTDSLNSASHGAGRAMSRQEAKASMTGSALKKTLAAAGVTLIGGSMEENPSAYKNIEAVMAAQTNLVSIQGKFMPRIVRMNNE